MDIGKEKEIVIIEPIADPLPAAPDAEPVPTAPVEPTVPEPEPDKVG